MHASLKRLQTDHIDLLQIHGRMSSAAGLLDGWTPPTDIADMPRVTFGLYKAEDANPIVG